MANISEDSAEKLEALCTLLLEDVLSMHLLNEMEASKARNSSNSFYCMLLCKRSI